MGICLNRYHLGLCRLNACNGDRSMPWAPFHSRFFHHNSNSIDISFNCNLSDHITTKFCAWHDNAVVLPCAKFGSDHFIRLRMRAKWIFHHISIVMEKYLMKCRRAHFTNECYIVIQIRWTFVLLSSTLLWADRSNFKHGHLGMCKSICAVIW